MCNWFWKQFLETLLLTYIFLIVVFLFENTHGEVQYTLNVG
jgi:hypothetical protein